MASCQRIYEQKAFEAEEKLRKWRKDNPQKGDKSDDNSKSDGKASKDSPDGNR